MTILLIAQAALHRASLRLYRVLRYAWMHHGTASSHYLTRRTDSVVNRSVEKLRNRSGTARLTQQDITRTGHTDFGGKKKKTPQTPAVNFSGYLTFQPGA